MPIQRTLTVNEKTIVSAHSNPRSSITVNSSVIRGEKKEDDIEAVKTEEDKEDDNVDDDLQEGRTSEQFPEGGLHAWATVAGA